MRRPKPKPKTEPKAEPASAPALDWYKDAVIYQLHVKSFFDSNGDGIGDFPGLIAKLDYIVDLGVDTVWLLPFYPSPRRDDGYDISDYRGVHPDYGSMADMRRFIRLAHERGLRVITELVINHTSDQHSWFQRARNAKPGSVARDFYVWSDTDQRYLDTRVIFLDTEKSNWTWDAVAGAYFWHRFYSHQPDLNFDNPRVLEEVISVMRYWLDMGVDGLRLDAIPYLVEREGTNSENLAETHTVLKKIRAALDERHPGRMLLAEANQWPEDVQQYFGDGDECHMAFHFPLMPRMYMSIAQEDRFPITDILRQTPALPQDCQWAIFLRNHDELTLEMVTDRERDYLWQTYAADRRARLNLGIRRRLSPLLENDRRRVELMNSLLLSMPGTPVLYYGDELGMGDNIHLGDRDGVRTPMQWSPDRNGGFSRTEPSRLVLPVIQDPLYSYDSINVEMQSSDQHSLLNWTRRIIAVRKRHRAFGRGALRFLYPGNRKVLAYLRELDDETVLCVNNLARTAQAVEIDLTAYAGRVPINIIGGSRFPPVGQLPYLLTLPPYGVYWLLLADGAHLPAWHQPAPEPMPEFATCVARNGLRDVLSPPVRKILEEESLPAYLPKRRWYPGKDGSVKAVRLCYAVPLAAADGTAMMQAEIEVDRADGATSRHVLPLDAIWEEEISSALPQQLALARIRQGRKIGFLTDAYTMGTLPRAYVRGWQQKTSIPLPEGEIVFHPTAALAGVNLPPDAEVRRLTVEQTNSSLIIGDAAVLKLIRTVNAGVHPEAEMSRHLTDAGFRNTPQLFGDLTRIGKDGTPHTLATLHAFVRNQGDGWTWTHDFLARSIEEMAVTGEVHEGGGDVLAAYMSFAANVGTRLAEMHATLAAPTDNADFAPVPVQDADLKAWARRVEDGITATLDLLAARREWPNEEARTLAAQLVGARKLLLRRPAALVRGLRGVLRTRVHGDFHLGQILVAQGDAFIIDFEGEPQRSLVERRAKDSPFRDVAGLLRSFDYAANQATSGPAASSASTNERRLPLLDQFRRGASKAFLEAYRAQHARSPQRWADDACERPLLDLFLLEKAVYEIRYEAANRPSWLTVPMRGLAELLEGTPAEILEAAGA